MRKRRSRIVIKIDICATFRLLHWLGCLMDGCLNADCSGRKADKDRHTRTQMDGKVKGYMNRWMDKSTCQSTSTLLPHRYEGACTYEHTNASVRV